jgi:large subunit ribosomal protein L17
MRHRKSGRHLARTSAHSLAMRRNLAQSLFQYGEIETTLIKAKEVRPFVERLITLARKNTLVSRQLAISMLNDRAALAKDEQERFDAMSYADRRRVMTARSGRRHRTGKVPASYNKNNVPFVATSVVNRLFTEVAPRYVQRPGGYTRIIRLAKRRIGDGTDLAILQLVGTEEPASVQNVKKTTGLRRTRAAARIKFLEGKTSKKKTRTTKSAKSSTPEKGAGEAHAAS